MSAFRVFQTLDRSLFPPLLFPCSITLFFCHTYFYSDLGSNFACMMRGIVNLWPCLLFCFCVCRHGTVWLCATPKSRPWLEVFASAEAAAAAASLRRSFCRGISCGSYQEAVNWSERSGKKGHLTLIANHCQSVCWDVEHKRAKITAQYQISIQNNNGPALCIIIGTCYDGTIRCSCSNSVQLYCLTQEM